MSNYSILRIGPIVEDSNDCHATVIREAILSRFQEEDGASNTTSTTSTNTNKKTALTISNRYFDANIMLLGMNESHTTNLNNEEEEVIAIEDGIMLIFDASLSTSFDILSTHHTTAVSNSQAGELLRLCIGTSYGPSPLSNGTKSSEEEYSRRVLWCLDHGYEYVEVDLTKEGMKRGFNDRDKDGFARVIEAIGSCMWSSHVMKPRNVAVGSSVGGSGTKEKLDSTSTTEASTAKDFPKNNDANNNISAKDNDKEEEELSETSTTASSLPDDYEEREKAAISSLMKDMNIEEHSSNPQQDQQQQQQQEDKKEEMAFHQLESVISEARLLREASKSNSMSDDERRARAGDTAMKLMGLLGSMGFDGDDSTDDEEERCDSSDDEES